MMKKSGDNLWLIMFASLLTLTIFCIYYPGFMTYDTLHALRGAQYGVTDSMWPPMVSYIWMVVDGISHETSMMFFFQLFLLNLSVTYIMYNLTNCRLAVSLVSLALYTLLPVILGTLSVIWKDVLYAALLLGSFATALSIRSIRGSHRYLIVALSIILLFLSICVRHNGIFGAVPVGYYIVSQSISSVYKAKTRIGTALVLVGILFSTKLLLDNYSLPSMRKLETSNSQFILSVRTLDLAGMSLCSGKNYIPEQSEKITIDDIRNSYDPRHVNLSTKLLEKVKFDERITQAWINAFLESPYCALYNKAMLTYYMFGLNSGEQFIITAPDIIDNEFGVKLERNRIMDALVDYTVVYSKKFYLKPWFIIFLMVLTIPVLLLQQAHLFEKFILFVSGSFYALSLIVFGNAADARLLFYSNTVFYILLVLNIYSIYHTLRIKIA